MFLEARWRSSNRRKGWTDSNERNSRRVNNRRVIGMLGKKDMQIWIWELDRVGGR